MSRQSAGNITPAVRCRSTGVLIVSRSRHIADSPGSRLRERTFNLDNSSVSLLHVAHDVGTANRARLTM